MTLVRRSGEQRKENTANGHYSRESHDFVQIINNGRGGGGNNKLRGCQSGR